MTRTRQFGFGSDPAHQWDTKRKPFSLAEVSTLPSAILLGSVLPSVTRSDFSFVCLSVHSLPVQTAQLALFYYSDALSL